MADSTPTPPTSAGRPDSTAEHAKREASKTADDAKAAASDVADSAKSAAEDVADKATDKAKAVAGDAASAAQSTAETGKAQATGALDDVADVLHDTSDSLRDHDRDAFAQYADQAARQVEQFTSAIRDRSVGEILDEAERFARREPGLFVGGAFLLGIFGARFLKADAPGSDRAGGSGMARSDMPSGPRHYATRTTGTDSPDVAGASPGARASVRRSPVWP